jgi:hypothetical protein
MSKLLNEAFDLASKLPEVDRDAIATTILREIATRQSTDAIEIQECPDTETLAYMEYQSQLFTQKKYDLLSQYVGLYVLFEDGQVLDADKDESALVLRAYETRGLKPLFVKKVVPVEPRLSIRGFAPPNVSA